MNVLSILIIVVSFMSTIYMGNGIRQKRQLIYRDKSRFFLRISIKSNVWPHTTIVAENTGFKVTWDVPHKPYPDKSFVRKRDISNALEDYIMRYGLTEYFCIFNYICKYLNNDLNNCGLICEMIDFIFKQNAEKEIFVNQLLTKCEEHSSKCDLQQFKLSSFTDLY